MRRLSIAGVAAVTVLQAHAAMAHPGHGVTPSGTPGHAFEHLAGIVATSPVAWLAVAALGLAAINLVRRRASPRPVRLPTSRRP
jgi:hypothetical protein